MAKITHPEMRRGTNVSAPNKPAPEAYVVDDLSEGEEQVDLLDKKIAEFEGQAEEPEQTTQVVVSPKAMQRQEPKKPSRALEKLIFMGRHSKEVEFAGHKFELGTLTHKENNDIVRRLMNFGEAADLFTIRVLTLVYSLKKIDGTSLDDIELEETFDDDFEKYSFIIDNMQVALVEKLHAAYEELVKESEQVVYGEAIKN